jgi:hypothetical protein
MILIHNHHRIMALAESYDGPDPFTEAPEDFNESRFEEYRLVNGEWVIPAPQQVSMRQARLALLGAGLLDSVDAAIAAIPDELQRKAAQIEWEYAAFVERDSPLIQQLAPALGMTEEQMDQLFVVASGL